MMLWEIIWCRHLSPLFHLFVALAIMSFIRDQIMMEELGFAEMIEVGKEGRKRKRKRKRKRRKKKKEKEKEKEKKKKKKKRKRKGELEKY